MIKAGQGDSVARELMRLPRANAPTEVLSKIANIAWRINRPAIGLKILFPEIRRRENLKERQDPDILTEYAGCLLEIGALTEAKMMLRDLGTVSLRSKFYLSLLLFKEWNYQGAIPVLESYLSQLPDDYHKLVVQVNLAAAYVIVGKLEEANALFAGLIPRLQKEGHFLLLGNCYEIQSQIPFYMADHQQALKILEESEKLLAGSKNMGWLYCKKWQFINRLSLAGSTNEELDVLSQDLKVTAVRMASWETLRELDLYTAIYSRDADLANHVYFGSPQAIYRTRVQSMTGDLELAGEHTWISSTGGHAASLYDLENVLGDSSTSFLVKKLLLILTSDFYAEFRTGQLFSQIFEGEFYNPETSPDRVFQLVRRLRAWFEVLNWKCRIDSKGGGYRLAFEENHGIVIARKLIESPPHDKVTSIELKLKKKFKDLHFTSKDAGEALSCSTRSANRLLKDLRSKGRVEVSGKARFARFKLAG